MQVEMMRVGRLVPYAGNARTHPEWQIAQIAASIAERGGSENLNSWDKWIFRATAA